MQIEHPQELRAELNFSMYRMNELKKTLEATKSFIKDRAPTRGNPLNPLGSLTPYKGCSKWRRNVISFIFLLLHSEC